VPTDDLRQRRPEPILPHGDRVAHGALVSESDFSRCGVALRQCGSEQDGAQHDRLSHIYFHLIPCRMKASHDDLRAVVVWEHVDEWRLDAPALF
jgi:hypothetical protein